MTNNKQEKKEKLKKLAREYVKVFMVFSGMMIVLITSGFSGYGYLHYVQGLNLMSSPIFLMQSYLLAGGVAFVITLLFSEWYEIFSNKLDKGDL